MNFKLITIIAIGCFALAFVDLYDLKHWQNWHKELTFGWVGVIGVSICLITVVFVPLFMKRK
jgi:hypothetical protein